MKEKVKNARQLYDIMEHIIVVFWEHKVRELKQLEDKQTEKIQEQVFSWMFKKEDGKNGLEDLILNTNSIEKDVKNDSNLKYIPGVLTKFMNKMLSGNISDLKKVEKEYNSILDRYDVRKLMSRKQGLKIT